MSTAANIHVTTYLTSRDPAWRERVQWFVVLLIVLVPSLYLSEFKLWTLFETSSLKSTGSFLASFFPPALSGEFLILVVKSAWVTVAVATAGVALAMIFAVPLSLIAARTFSISALATGRMRPIATALRATIRWTLVFLRSVPELVWGLLFVRAIGLGDTAGVLAIALAYTGMIGKVFLEVFESQDAKPAQALMQNGAGRLNAFFYGTLPVVLPELASYVVFRWECAIRSSVILGFVGAGGLGQQMDLSMKMLAGGEVFTMLVAFMLLVAFADLMSKQLRALFEKPSLEIKVGEAYRALTVRTFIVTAFVVVCVATLKGDWASLLSWTSVKSMSKLLWDFIPPAHDLPYLQKVAIGTLETLAVSFLGTLLALALAVLLAAPAAGFFGKSARAITRFILNGLRSVPELVWASMLVIAAGLGPLPGTLALAVHTVGVLGRLLADALENTPQEPYLALKQNGAGTIAAFCYGTIPMVLPQLASYTLYRWENNIRAAAVLGMVGGGGLGQLLYYHLGLFHFEEAATVLIAMLILVAFVDWASYRLRTKWVG